MEEEKFHHHSNVSKCKTTITKLAYKINKRRLSLSVPGRKSFRLVSLL